MHCIEFSYTVNHVFGLVFDVTNLMCSKEREKEKNYARTRIKRIYNF